MKKSSLVLVVLGVVGLFTSCKSPSYSSTYMVNYKNGQYQVLTYPHDWDVLSMVDTTGELKIDHIDTLEYKVKNRKQK